MFTGFPKEGVSWFQALALAQSREWFQAHKGAFDELWVQPMKALLDELSAPLAKVYGRPLGPPKLFRLNRDLRFSKDKTPYKTHIAGMLPFEGAAAMSGPAALYLHLGLNEVVGFGYYVLGPAELKRLRQSILQDATGRPLQKLVDSAQKRGLEFGGLDKLRRPPPGVDADHPRVELLKQKGLAVSRTDIPKKVRFGKELKPWLLEQAKLAAPILKWGFARRLG